MVQLVILRGLPASGKTTWAKRWVTEDPRIRARINRDDLRAMAHNGVHLPPEKRKRGTENMIIAMERALIRELLQIGVSVVIDDTNLASFHIDGLKKLTDTLSHRVEIQIIDFRGVPLHRCLERDALRFSEVGPEVIRGMYSTMIDEIREEHKV